MLWAKPNTYVYNDWNGLAVVATTGRVVLEAKTVGQQSALSDFNVLALDTLTGAVLWSQGIASPSLLAVENSTLYFGSYGNIALLEVETGSRLQDVDLPNGGNVMSLQVSEGSISTYTSSGRFIFYNRDDGGVTSTEPDFTRFPVFIEQGVLYVGEDGRFRAKDAARGTTIWETTLEQGAVKGLVFTDDMIFFRGGDVVNYFGNLYAISRRTGELVWKKQLDVLSNVELLGTRIFVLTLDGRLMILDRQTGESLSEVKISATPFAVNEPESNTLIGGYYLAADQRNGIVVISLGDSCQLVALQIAD